MDHNRILKHKTYVFCKKYFFRFSTLIVRLLDSPMILVADRKYRDFTEFFDDFDASLRAKEGKCPCSEVPFSRFCIFRGPGFSPARSARSASCSLGFAEVQENRPSEVAAVTWATHRCPWADHSPTHFRDPGRSEDPFEKKNRKKWGGCFGDDWGH